MEFDDFEPLEGISDSSPPKNSEPGKVQSVKQGDGAIGLDDFADFQAGIRDHDDDQSSVYTDDYIERRLQQGGENRSFGEEDFEDEYDDIWKNHMPEMAKSASQTGKTPKEEEKVLNQFYAGAGGFFFGNLMGDSTKKLEEPSPIYGNKSETKVSASSANSLTDRPESQPDVGQPTGKRKEEEIKPMSLLSLNNKQNQNEEAHDAIEEKLAESKEMIPSMNEPLVKDIPSSSDVKSANEEQEQESERRQEVKKEPQQQQEVKENLMTFQGITEGDFQSFVEDHDNYSQDDSKYEGSFVSLSEHEMPDSHSQRGEHKSKILDELLEVHEEKEKQPSNKPVIETTRKAEPVVVKQESSLEQRRTPSQRSEDLGSSAKLPQVQSASTQSLEQEKSKLENKDKAALFKKKEESVNMSSSVSVKEKNNANVKPEESLTRSQPQAVLLENKDKKPPAEKEQLFKREAPVPQVKPLQKTMSVPNKEPAKSIHYPEEQQREPVQPTKPIQPIIQNTTKSEIKTVVQSSQSSQPNSPSVKEIFRKEIKNEVAQQQRTSMFARGSEQQQPTKKEVQAQASQAAANKRVETLNIVQEPRMESSPYKKPVALSQETTKQVIYTPEKKPEPVPAPVEEKVAHKKQVEEKVVAKQPEQQEIMVKKAVPVPVAVSKSVSKSSTPTANAARRVDSLEIKCSFHPTENLEKICFDPNFPKKRLLCFECGVEASKEMQKYKASTQPIAQYVLGKIREYCETERQTEIPEEYIENYRNLQTAEERFSSNINEDIEVIKESLGLMKAELLGKFEEIESSLEELSSYKISKLVNNRDFFEKTLETHFTTGSGSSGGAPQADYNELVSQLGAIENEQEFEKFVSSLSVDNSYANPEVKNYFKVLSHKINSLCKNTKLNLPNRTIFQDLKSKNVNISQLQEQLLINLTSVKSTIYELLDANYTVEDITKTRIVPSNTLTPDNSNVTFPLNKITDELMRYRLTFDSEFKGPDANSISCITVIDNEILVAGTAQKSITLWNLASGEFLETIQAHDDGISAVHPYKASMSDLRDRKPYVNTFKEDIVTFLISIGGKNDKNILLWDISWIYDYVRGRGANKQQSKLIRKLESQTPGISTVLPILDGITLVNGTYDGRICVWNVIKNRLGGQIKQHEAPITSLKMMRCKEKFAAGSLDKKISIWRISYKEIYDPENRNSSKRRIFEGFELEKILDPGFKILCLGASIVNKNWLAFGGSMDRLVIWDIETGKLVKELECDRNDLSDIVWVEDPSSQKMVLFGVCNEDDVIRAWDTNYTESNETLSEVYNLKHREKICVRKGASHGSAIQLVQDGIIKIAVVNSAKNKNSVSLWNVELGV